MSAARKLKLISVEEYLESERHAPIKREYIGGVVYAMSGVRLAHDIIAGNTFASWHARLRGRPCRPHTSDVKVRIQLRTHTRFYYPNAQVVCASNPLDEYYQDQPVVIAEVLSKSTRRIDEGEKKDAYLAIPSLGVYLLIEQDMPAVVAYRRVGDDFVREIYEGLYAVIPLPEIGAELPLGDVYERIEFAPEARDEEPS